MSTFTSWAALKQSVLDAIASGDIMTQSVNIGDKTITYRTLKEAIDLIRLCDIQIGVESGSTTAFSSFGGRR